MCDSGVDEVDTSSQRQGLEESAKNAGRRSAKSERNADRMQGEVLSVNEQLLGAMRRTAKAQWNLGQSYLDRAAQFDQAGSQYLQNALDYNSAWRQDLEAGRAMASVQQTYDAQRQNAMRQLESYGVDPSQMQSGALDNDARMQMAAMQAMAGNQARDQMRQEANQMLVTAENMGNYEQQFGAQQQAQAQNAMLAGTGAYTSANMGATDMANKAGQGWTQLEQAGYNNSGNLAIGEGTANAKIADSNAANSALGQTMAGIGTIGGAVANIYTGGLIGGADGGQVPQELAPTPQPGDTVPAMLKPGERVIPADVVKYMGEKFFADVEKKVRKATTGEAIPAGQKVQ